MLKVVMMVINSITTYLPATSTTAGLINGFATFGGSTLCGIFMRYAMKKILKLAVIVLGVIAGVIFLTIQWMSNRGYIHGMEYDMVKYGQHLLSQHGINSIHGLVHTLGIPVTSGLGIGLTVGLLKG